MAKYLHEMPIAPIIDQALLRHLKSAQQRIDDSGSVDFVKSDKANTLIRNAIENGNWGEIERLSGPLVSYFNQVLDAEVLAGQQKADFLDLAERYVLKIRNSRSLYGVDLARFFKLIRQL